MSTRRILTRRVVLLGGLLVGLPLALILALVAAVAFLDQSNGSIVSSGRQRAFLLHVPPGHDPARPTPLVISLHGAALWPAFQRDLSGWDRLADEQGFIVVYPAAAGMPRIWNVDRVPGLAADVRFIADLIDHLALSYRIDPARIYVSGMSNGGGMAFVLSCTLSARIAAIGMVAGAQSLSWDWCTDTRPIPMIEIHGTADPVIPYGGGPSPAGPDAVFPSIAGWAANWARRNGCAPQARDARVAADVTSRRYGTCTAGADVELYTVEGGGHTWPGGRPMPRWLVGPTATDLDATRLQWAFFVAHPLQAVPREPSR